MTRPDTALLCKLASVVVHADELLGPDASGMDHHALAALLVDPDVKAWIAEMSREALAPVPRSRTYSEDGS